VREAPSSLNARQRAYLQADAGSMRSNGSGTRQCIQTLKHSDPEQQQQPFICDRCGHHLSAAELQEWPRVLLGDGRRGIGCLNCPQGTFGIAWSQPEPRHTR
jgi:hypothetical protein